jgi:hypothetical protein
MLVFSVQAKRRKRSRCFTGTRKQARRQGKRREGTSDCRITAAELFSSIEEMATRE